MKSIKEYHSAKMFPDPALPVLVTRLKQRSEMLPHTHDFIELVLVAQGHTIHSVELKEKNFSYGLIQGDCFTILPGEVHAYSESKNLVLYNVAFQKSFLRSELPELEKLPLWIDFFEADPRTLRNSLHLPPNERLRAERFLQKIMIEHSRRQEGYIFRIKLALLEVICSINEANIVSCHPYDNEQYSGILKTLDYMEKIVAQPFDLGKMAKMAGMSVSSYTQKFRNMIGDSPNEYFLGIKLEKIRSELLHSELSITELAYKYGFCDGSYMIKQFRKRHGISPAKYRSIISFKV